VLSAKVLDPQFQGQIKERLNSATPCVGVVVRVRRSNCG
jgi:DNA gyrase/topoisomerase IV subunit B